MIICSFGGSTRTRNLFAFSGSLEKIGNCKSRLGGVIFMGYDSGAIYNESVQDTFTAHSSAETEVRACVRLELLGHCSLYYWYTY